MRQHVFIATSLDGRIADGNNGLDFLQQTPNPTGDDLGYGDFIATVDAIVMGRNTYDVVAAMDIDWPYRIPVVVLTNRPLTLTEEQQQQVRPCCGSVAEVMAQMSDWGYHSLYIDGGQIVQQFLAADCIDSLTITQIPVVLGQGPQLFAELTQPLWWQLEHSQVLLEQLVQTRYRRQR
ncbi:dihydrofolate reductase [uncultured Ferrimonas sp.]|uniref:dihydrofolate reductase family protein n=1 Tax=uncultured Ferrimonas sp. TaxID=432640 RepID=UPI00260C608B|nr:dihydrofolate reductase [uncultured Ferrimonas sp.]